MLKLFIFEQTIQPLILLRNLSSSFLITFHLKNIKCFIIWLFIDIDISFFCNVWTGPLFEVPKFFPT